MKDEIKWVLLLLIHPKTQTVSYIPAYTCQVLDTQRWIVPSRTSPSRQEERRAHKWIRTQWGMCYFRNRNKLLWEHLRIAELPWSVGEQGKKPHGGGDIWAGCWRVSLSSEYLLFSILVTWCLEYQLLLLPFFYLNLQGRWSFWSGICPLLSPVEKRIHWP